MFFVSATKPTKDPEVSPAAAMDATPKPKGDKAFYRYDLDGLRGIAIFLVAVFHVWFGRVSGGVDVFLTLSGFFYGSKLLRTATTQELPSIRCRS